MNFLQRLRKKSGQRLLVIFLPLFVSLISLSSSSSAASFDCHKARSGLEKMICADGDLSKADEALSGSYKKALAQLSEPARQVIKKGQLQWLKAVQQVCNTNLKHPVFMELPTNQQETNLCVDDAFGDRKRSLDQLVVSSGGLTLYAVDLFSVGVVLSGEEKPDSSDGPLRYEDYTHMLADVHVQYPQIDRPGNDAQRTWNKLISSQFAEWNKKPAYEEQGGGHFEHFYELNLVTPDLISLTVWDVDWDGSRPHPHHNMSTANWLVSSARELTPDDLFNANNPSGANAADWHDTLQKIGHDIAMKNEDIVDCIGNDNAFDPGSVADDPDHWFLTKEGLGIKFGIYELGAYACGSPSYVIPWARIKPLLTPNAVRMLGL